MIGADTNVLLRWLVRDDERQAASADRLFDGGGVRIGLVVLAEAIWVLRTHYAADRSEIVDMLIRLLSDTRVDLQDRAAVAVVAHETLGTASDISDLLIEASNTLHGCETTFTFDRKASRRPGMSLLA